MFNQHSFKLTYCIIYSFTIQLSYCDSNPINEAFDYWKNILEGSKRFLGTVNEKDVQFVLFNKKFDEIFLDATQDNIYQFFLPEIETKFIVHGWGESRFRPYYRTLTEEYTKKGDYNIVHVDWSKVASVEYNVAVENTFKVGKILGEFITKLLTSNITTHENVHLLGHSLGGHIVGVSGKEIFKLTGLKVRRITGLDPAGPSFEIPPIEIQKRLDKHDAEMVDVVHTDGGIFGFMEPLGTVDFYPNGGKGLQPGCSLFKISIPPTIKSATDYAFCSHTRSYIYFINSINEKMIAKKCNSWAQFQNGDCDGNENVVFGEDVPFKATGSYFLSIV
ncbi:lipase member H-A-like isoform X1 [Onthophagus taurus]|uniref:lipase member H-A-like isoform X1 n=1 Tax=Onthophagus taurus TaxID=166361 RepID=UPI0039BE69F7